MNPLVSIVIVTWNREGDLRDCLNSIRKLDYAPFEVIVVDDCSADGTVEMLKKDFPEVKIIQNSKNFGFSKANNHGIENAKGEIICTLNSDTVVEKRFIEEALKLFEKDKMIGIVQSKMVFFDRPQKINSVGHIILKNGRVNDLGLGRDEKEFSIEIEIFSACAGAAFYKKKMLEEIKLAGQYFDEDFFMYVEDVDLSFRARLKGWNAFFCPKSIIRHKLAWKDLKGPAEMANFLSLRNTYWLIVKDFPLPLLIKFAPRILFFALGYFFKEKKLPKRLIFKAYCHSVFGLPKMLLKRLQIQKTKKVSAKEIERWLT